MLLLSIVPHRLKNEEILIIEESLLSDEFSVCSLHFIEYNQFSNRTPRSRPNLLSFLFLTLAWIGREILLVIDNRDNKRNLLLENPRIRTCRTQRVLSRLLSRERPASRSFWPPPAYSRPGRAVRGIRIRFPKIPYSPLPSIC